MKVVAQLLPRLEDNDPVVRQTVVQVLGQLPQGLDQEQAPITP